VANESTKLYMGNYATLFLAYAFMVGLWFFAPIVVSVIGGLVTVMIGATLITKYQMKHTGQMDMFEAAKRLGKKVVFAFLPGNEVEAFLADWNIGANSIKMKLYDGKRWKIVEQQLSPEQEFSVSVPDIEFKEGMSIYDVIENPNVLWKLRNPKKQVWKIRGKDVPAVFMVFPEKILSSTQLQAWNLSTDGTTEKIKIQMREPKTGEVSLVEQEIPVFSPLSYAISSDEIQTLSATHRYSELSTFLNASRDLVENAERIVAGKVGKVGGGGFIDKMIQAFKNTPQLLIILIILVGLTLGTVILVKGFGGAFSSGLVTKAAATAGTKPMWP